MDRALLERIVEAHLRDRTHAPQAEVWLEAEGAPLLGANIERALVDEQLAGYVLTSNELREGYRSRNAPTPQAIRRALSPDVPLFVFVEPNTDMQEQLAGPYRAIATDPRNILAGTEFHVPITTHPRIAQAPTRETNYIAIPEFTRASPSEALLARAHVPATYVLLDAEGPMREVTFERRAERSGPLRYAGLPEHKTS